MQVVNKDHPMDPTASMRDAGMPEVDGFVRFHLGALAVAVTLGAIAAVLPIDRGWLAITLTSALTTFLLIGSLVWRRHARRRARLLAQAATARGRGEALANRLAARVAEVVPRPLDGPVRIAVSPPSRGDDTTCVAWTQCTHGPALIGLSFAAAAQPAADRDVTIVHEAGHIAAGDVELFQRLEAATYALAAANTSTLLLTLLHLGLSRGLVGVIDVSTVSWSLAISVIGLAVSWSALAHARELQADAFAARVLGKAVVAEWLKKIDDRRGASEGQGLGQLLVWAKRAYLQPPIYVRQQLRTLVAELPTYIVALLALQGGLVLVVATSLGTVVAALLPADHQVGARMLCPAALTTAWPIVMIWSARTWATRLPAWPFMKQLLTLVLIAAITAFIVDGVFWGFGELAQQARVWAGRARQHSSASYLWSFLVDALIITAVPSLGIAIGLGPGCAIDTWLSRDRPHWMGTVTSASFVLVHATLVGAVYLFLDGNSPWLTLGCLCGYLSIGTLSLLSYGAWFLIRRRKVST